MLQRFRFAELAEAEFNDAVAFYEERAPGKGLELAREVYATIQQALAFPESGVTVAAPGLRRTVRRYVLAGVFPYQLIASVLGEDTLMVFAIAHQSREPTYWIERAR